MNKRDYLNNLLALCSEWQIELFHKLYPKEGGPSSTQLSWATKQLENTLRKGNSQRQDVVGVQKELDEANKNAAIEQKEAARKLSIVQADLDEANDMIERLSNPINLENNKVQERLDLLQALENGGVDNWQWYEESIANYKRMQIG